MALHVGSGFSVRSLRITYCCNTCIRYLTAEIWGSHAKTTYLAVGANLGLLLSLLLSGNGPVNKEEVDVVESQALQRVLRRPDDILITVQVVPDLGAHEDVLTLDRGVLLKEVPDGFTNLALIEIEPGTVQVSVAGTESVKGSLV